MNDWLNGYVEGKRECRSWDRDETDSLQREVSDAQDRLLRFQQMAEIRDLKSRLTAAEARSAELEDVLGWVMKSGSWRASGALLPTAQNAKHPWIMEIHGALPTDIGYRLFAAAGMDPPRWAS